MTFCRYLNGSGRPAISDGLRAQDVGNDPMTRLSAFRLSPVRTSAALASLVGALTLACGGSAPPSETPSAAMGGRCETTWATEAFSPDPAEEPSLPESTLWLEGRAPVDRILSEVRRQVPERLATDRRQELGVAGRATYSVRRGAPYLEEKNGQLALHVPITANIEVCKPFGRTCVRYGQCQPEFLASFHVAGTIAKNYRMSPPRGTLQVKRRCVIGLDVTPRLVQEAEKELKAVEREIAQALPAIEPAAREVWQELQTPRKLGDDACLRFLPTSVSHTRARLRNGHVEMALGVSGSFALGCETTKPASLPPLASSTWPVPASELWVPSQVEFHVLGAALEELLPLPEGTRLTSLELLAHGRRLALRVAVDGNHCGDVWLSAQPTYDALGGELRLSDPKVETPASGPGAAFATELAAALAELRLGAPLDMEPGTAVFQQVLRDGLKHTSGLTLRFDVDPPKRGSAQVHARGILLSAALAPRVSLLPNP